MSIHQRGPARLRVVSAAADLLTVDDVMAALHCSRRTVFALCGSGALRSIKVGRRRLVHVDDLEQYVRTLRGADR